MINCQALGFLSKIWLTRDNDIVKSKLFLENSIAINPNDGRFAFEYGMVLFYAGEHQLGQAAFDRAEYITQKLITKYLARYITTINIMI